VPASDDVVLERLPEKLDPSLRQLKSLRTALASHPDNLDLAVRLARRAIEAARETGDPRFLGQAQAALSRWWALADPPPEALLLRATLRQSTHDFTGALRDLDKLISSRPFDGQALLTRATVLGVIGRSAEARADCARLAAPIVTAACDASPASLSGEARTAYASLIEALKRGPADPGVREWALTLAGEIAQRRGDTDAAEAHFRAALALDARDPYLQATYADFLLERGRTSEVVAMLRNSARNDSLLLRLALAESRLPAHRDDYLQHRADLAERFDAARLRGDSLHRREEARYTLELASEPRDALKLAKANWGVQRESADLRILVAAAIAADDAATLREASEWVRSTRLEDVAVLAMLEGK
jgi:Flp pilus assembly protein TadD